VPGVVVTGDQGSLAIAGTPLQGTLVLTAVGEPETLAGSLTRAGGLIAQLASQYPTVTVKVVPVDRLAVPASGRDQSPALGRPRL